MSAPEPWERMRMALADMGMDPGLVGPPPPGSGALAMTPWDFPLDLAWKAREVAAAGDPICHRCYEAIDGFQIGPVTCLAGRRLVTDCGAVR